MSQSRNKVPNGDAEHEEEIQYGSEEARNELDEKPHNFAKTLLFSDLYRELFNPLNENKRQPTGGVALKKGPRGQTQLSPREQRRHIIDRFIARIFFCARLPAVLSLERANAALATGAASAHHRSLHRAYIFRTRF
ncbi:hypothetical protein PWT90_08921 [Aphanocladium album]|nr:hypothetical protein PWT90_08921 [Aphanocladium album]